MSGECDCVGCLVSDYSKQIDARIDDSLNYDGVALDLAIELIYRNDEQLTDGQVLEQIELLLSAWRTKGVK